MNLFRKTSSPVRQPSRPTSKTQMEKKNEIGAKKSLGFFFLLSIRKKKSDFESTRSIKWKQGEMTDEDFLQLPDNKTHFRYFFLSFYLSFFRSFV
jgi:hypothetical protein